VIKTGRELRRRTLVNRGFQIKYASLLAGVAMLIFIVLGFLYSEVLREENSLLGLRNTAPAAVATGLTAADREFDADLSGRVEADDVRRITALAVAAGLLVLLLAWLGIRLSFRAAGPVVAVSNMLKAMAGGDFRCLRRLRDEDEFRFLEEDLFALRDALRQEAAAHVAALDAAAAALGDGTDPGARKAALDAAVAARTRIAGRWEL
jgi:hypothetical protein